MLTSVFNIGSILQAYAANEPPAELSILVIGETGAGKSTLINNLLGTKLVGAGHTLQAETVDITKCVATVRGVPIVLYDTPGEGDICRRKPSDKKKLQSKIRATIKRKKTDLVIFCVQMNTTRCRNAHYDTLKFYDEAGIKWENTLIALTFAESVPIPQERLADAALYFTEKRDEWQTKIKDGLLTIGVPQKVADKVLVCPTTNDTKKKLMNGEEWFMPLFMNVLKVVPPIASFRFVDINSNAVIGERAEIIEIHQSIFEILKEKVDHYLLQGLCFGGALANPAALGLAALAGGITTIILVKSMIVAGAVSCGVGSVLILGAAGLAVAVIGGVAVYIYLRSRAKDAIAEDD